MIETVRNASIDNERRHIWRNIAGKRTEIAEARMNDSGVASELKALDGSNCAG